MSACFACDGRPRVRMHPPKEKRYGTRASLAPFEQRCLVCHGTGHADVRHTPLVEYRDELRSEAP